MTEQLLTAIAVGTPLWSVMVAVFALAADTIALRMLSSKLAASFAILLAEEGKKRSAAGQHQAIGARPQV